VLKASSECFTELVLAKASAAFDETCTILNQLDTNVATAWWETLPPFDAGEGGERRRWLDAYANCVRASTKDIVLLHKRAQALKAVDDDMLAAYESLAPAGVEAAKALEEAYRSYPSKDTAGGDNSDLDVAVARLAKASEAVEKEWTTKGAGRISPEAAAFLFVFWGILQDTELAIKAFQNTFAASKPPTFAAVLGYMNNWQPEQDRTHPRFVLRNTVSITLAFFMGFVGVGDILPAYTFMPAGVIAVIIYKYAGASQRMSLDRLTGVVLGKVLGTLILLAFAVKKPVYCGLYAIAMYKLIKSIFYGYVADVSGSAFVACLTVGYAGSAMVPTAPFRDGVLDLDPSVQQGLLQNIINAVIGVAIMTVVDLKMANRASKLLKETKQSAITFSQKYAKRVCKQAVYWNLPDTKEEADAANEKAGLKDAEPTEDEKSQLLKVKRQQEEVEAKQKAINALGKLTVSRQKCTTTLAKMAELIEPASAEPKYWRPPLKHGLYSFMQQRLTEFHQHLDTVVWAIQAKSSSSNPQAESKEESDVAQFQEFFPKLMAHIDDRMHNILILSFWATRTSLEDQDQFVRHTADSVRNDLMKLHFFEDLESVKSGSKQISSRFGGPTEMNERRQRRHGPKPYQQRRGVGKLMDTVTQVFHEGVEIAPLPDLSQGRRVVSSLETILKDLEDHCGATQKTFSAEDTLFRVGRVELVVQVVRGLLRCMDQLELQLLEY